jgi:DNA-binding transcriptional MerR regulator
MPRRTKTIDKIRKMKRVRISEIAELNGVRYSTVKHYAELGLLPFMQDGPRLAKYYPVKEASQRLKDILKMKERGRFVPEIVSHYTDKRG